MTILYIDNGTFTCNTYVKTITKYRHNKDREWPKIIGSYNMNKFLQMVEGYFIEIEVKLETSFAFR